MNRLAVWISVTVITLASVQAGDSVVSIADFGAIGDGETDNHDALQKALDEAHSQGKTLHIPKGTFAYSGVLHDIGVSIEGAGPASVLKALDPHHSTLFVSGDGAHLHNFKLVCPAAEKRESGSDARGIHLQEAKHFHLDHLTIEHVAGAGILAYKSEQGQIDHNVVVDRLADGIHLIEARYNTVLSNKWGRGMSVVGGKHVLLEHNLVDGVDAAGIYISQEKEYKTFEPIDVRVEKNVVKNAGSQKSGHGSLMVYCAQRPSRQISFTENYSIRARKAGFVFTDGSRVSETGTQVRLLGQSPLESERRLPDAGVRQSR